eukprot:4273608-Pleurochrysis_carterae.AAC.2
MEHAQSVEWAASGCALGRWIRQTSDLASQLLAVGTLSAHPLPTPLIRRIYVIQQKQQTVPSVAGASGDGMAPPIHHCPSKY